MIQIVNPAKEPNFRVISSLLRFPTIVCVFIYLVIVCMFLPCENELILLILNQSQSKDGLNLEKHGILPDCYTITLKICLIFSKREGILEHPVFEPVLG